MHVTKRNLGEGYIIGTSSVLACILLGMVVFEGIGIGLWVTVGLIPVLGLGVLTYWIHTLDLTGEQVWRVSEYAAFGIGVVTLLLVVLHAFVQFLTVSTELAIALATTAAAATITGALVGVARQLHRSEEKLRLRNAVLYRLLRHNLRNDMTVVLAHLHEVKRNVDEQDRQQLEAAERKIDALVELTDKVRQMNIAMEDDRPTTATDLVSVVERRIEHVAESYPDIEVTTALPETAPTYVSEQFGVVIDNIVESAIADSDDVPELHVEISVDRDEVVLQLEDRGETIPESDLSAIATGSESDMEHACGMELWLVYWVADRNDGDVSVVSDDASRCIEISLERAFERNPVLRQADD